MLVFDSTDDWTQFHDKTLRVTWPGGATADVVIKDMCDRRDASCANKWAAGGTNFLVDVHRDTVDAMGDDAAFGGDPCWAVGTIEVV